MILTSQNSLQSYKQHLKSQDVPQRPRKQKIDNNITAWKNTESEPIQRRGQNNSQKPKEGPNLYLASQQTKAKLWLLWSKHNTYKRQRITYILLNTNSVQKLNNQTERTHNNLTKKNQITKERAASHALVLMWKPKKYTSSYSSLSNCIVTAIPTYSIVKKNLQKAWTYYRGK